MIITIIINGKPLYNLANRLLLQFYLNMIYKIYGISGGFFYFTAYSDLSLNSSLQLLTCSCVALSGRGRWYFRRNESIKECGIVILRRNDPWSHVHCCGKTSQFPEIGMNDCALPMSSAFILTTQHSSLRIVSQVHTLFGKHFEGMYFVSLSILSACFQPWQASDHGLDHQTESSIILKAT